MWLKTKEKPNNNKFINIIQNFPFYGFKLFSLFLRGFISFNPFVLGGGGGSRFNFLLLFGCYKIFKDIYTPQIFRTILSLVGAVVYIKDKHANATVGQ